MSPPPPPPPPPPATSTTTTSHSSGTSLPVVAIAILGILTTAIFLLTYYIFVIKCCLHWRTSDLLLRISSRSRRRPIPSPTSDVTNAAASGLDPSAIGAIPTFRYSAGACGSECAVCLLEFRAAERLRLLPGCNHPFHIDCIDTWLQSNASCPMCRAEVTDPLQMLAQQLNSAQCVAVDVREEAAPRKGRKQGVSMGDECIEVRREKGEFFDVQTMRRSLSMDSSSDRQLYLSVQEILRRNPDMVCGEGCSNAGGGSGSVRRLFFSFGHGRCSRNVVRPVHMDV